jgi:hypothetical protein
MQSVEIAGFWSYAHRDNDRDGGRVLRLAHVLQDEFALLTGSQLDVFMNRDSLKWRDEWRLRIENALATTTFFIPVITPLYFKSEECRKELLHFVGQARSVGAEELVFPLLYIDVPVLHADEPGDEAIAVVRARQWQDCLDLRLLAESDPGFRQRLSDLARRLIEINESLPAASEARYRPDSGDAGAIIDGSSAEPGCMELFAEAEDAMPRWIEAIAKLPEIIERLGALADEYGGKLNASEATGQSFAVQLRITRQFAEALGDQADVLLRLGQEYSASVVALDPAVLSLARIVEDNPEEATPEEIHGFVLLVRELAAQAREATGQLGMLVQAFDQARKMTRQLGPPIEKLKQGVRQLIDPQAVFDEWERRLSNLDR